MSLEQYKLFTVLMRLEGSIQLYNGASQVATKSNKKYQNYYIRNMNLRKEMIEVFANAVNIKGTPEEIASNKIPIITELIGYPPYMEYLKKYTDRESFSTTETEDHHPYYT